jgi:hypothetical protein
MGITGIYERRLADVLDRLTRAGYDEQFRGEPGGVRGVRSGQLHHPQDLEIERIERFEGISDPSDETLVLALYCRAHDCRGTYVVPYGKDMPTTDANLIRKIPDARPH